MFNQIMRIVENFLSSLETAEILADENFVSSIKIGIQQADSGDDLDIAQVEAELRL